MNTVPCIRCGVCCILGACGLGKEDEETGLCEHLEFHDKGYAICKLYHKHKDAPMFNSGCIVRADDDLYAMAVELAEQRGRKIKGKKNARNKTTHI